MQEITLDELYDVWVYLKEFRTKQYDKLNTKIKFRRFSTFGEYHTWILKEGKYKVV